MCGVDQSPASIYVKELSFHGGANLKLEDNSIVVLVGPNNSGKSLSLKEIAYLSNNVGGNTQSVSSLVLQRVGNMPGLLDRLSPYKGKRENSYQISDNEYRSTSQSDIEKAWESEDRSLGELTNFFIAHLTTGKRLDDSDPADTFDTINRRTGTHPIHNIYYDQDKELEVSKIFQLYFGVDLIVHRGPGRKIPLYVGVRPILRDGETVNSRSYLDRVEDLETLEDQGDGLRSFASILLRVWTGSHSILLVDEPEAFLHPPQARAVGELISSSDQYQRQVFISTHSNDVIQGILSKFPDRVSVVRLDRSGDLGRATYLSNAKITELWRDPILRYSNVFNGLFHHNVVVSEADADCRFYEAVADTQDNGNRSTFYTYAGGKDRIPVIVQALVALHVPVHTVVDIDIFAGDKAIRGIIEAYGHNWDQYRQSIKNIRDVIQSKKSWLLGAGFKGRISDLMKDIKDNETVPKEKLTQISSALREASPWDVIKDGGIAAVPSGDPAKQLQELMGALERTGMFVVPVGQMERFCRSIGRHGPLWVAEVLKKDLALDAELEDARLFVRKILTFDATVPPTPKVAAPLVKRLRLTRIDENKAALYDAIRSIGNIARTVFFVSLAIWVVFDLMKMFFSWLLKGNA